MERPQPDQPSAQREPDPATTPVVAVVAPSCPVDRALADRMEAIAPNVTLRWSSQCFATGGHFAGSDADRADALVAAWNDPTVDAVWCARGGAGAARIAAEAVARFDPGVGKPLLGYSDAGFLHAALLRAGRTGAVWSPMPADLTREGGTRAIARAIALLTTRDPPAGGAACAFNLTVLCATLGTGLEPPLAGRELWLEDVGEPLYRIDRLLFQLSSQPWFRDVTGVRLGRFGGWKNDRPFGASLSQVAEHWLARAGVPLLDSADIGHDADNTVVCF